MVGMIVLGIPPVCIGELLLAYRLATALCLDAVDHRLQFLGSVDRQHLAQVVAFLVPVLELHWPPGVVGPLSVRWRVTRASRLRAARHGERQHAVNRSG